MFGSKRAKHQSDSVAEPLPLSMVDSGGPEIEELSRQAKQGELGGLRDYLVRTRAQADWQDRVFVLSQVAPNVRLAALDFASDTEPESADLSLIRCAFFSELALTVRGTETCDQIESERFQNAADCVKAALTALQKAAELDRSDPTAYAAILPSLTIFSELQRWQQDAFQRAIELAPDLVPVYRTVTNSLTKRWYGSHEQSLEFARKAMTKARPGSDMAVCLFWAHSQVHGHLQSLDRNAKAADAYMRDSTVRGELQHAFDAWTSPPYAVRRSSIPYLHTAARWFFLTGDRDRLQMTLALVGEAHSERTWRTAEHEAGFQQPALRFAAHPSPAGALSQDACEECLALISWCGEPMRAGNFADAETSLASALTRARSAPPEQGRHLLPLVLANLSLLRELERRTEESNKLREQAIASLDDNQDQFAHSGYQWLMAEVLERLGEYRRSLPFWEQAVRLAGDEVEAPAMAGMLSSMGACYNRIGLYDHAAVPLRAAVKIFRSLPGDPRLPSVLLSYGNSLRKSEPAEAEAVYREAAHLHAGQLQYQSASAAWVNLGILFSEQGRFEEALDFYQKALRVREKTAGTPRSSRALVLINLANCYRRMGRFPEAHLVIVRAIELLGPEDELLASAYGTQGMIYLDSRDDANAVIWLRKAIAERKAHPSPNLELMVENLENEIGALRRLSRDREADLSLETLAVVRASMQSVAHADYGAGEAKPPSAGAVLVELTNGNRPNLLEERKNTSFLCERLSRQVHTERAGYYSGWVAVPENTTLIFYGPDAERLLQALEPALASDPICVGARVVVRQRDMHREMIVSQHAIAVN
jgi:tetratricopeptide (TPR) repeat protein